MNNMFKLLNLLLGYFQLPISNSVRWFYFFLHIAFLEDFLILIIIKIIVYNI